MLNGLKIKNHNDEEVIVKVSNGRRDKYAKLDNFLTQFFMNPMKLYLKKK